MYDRLLDLIAQWNFQEQERYHYLRLFPGHPQASQDLARTRAAFFAALDGPADRAYGPYEEARNHMSVLQEDAAFLAGLRAGLRLCLRL